MQKTYTLRLTAGALCVLTLVLLGMKYPAPLYSPGDVVTAHADLRCKNCHAPFQKIPSESCAAAGCHPEGKTGKKAASMALHNAMKGKDCLLCHTEHLGVQAKITKPLDHANLGGGLKCADCHRAEFETAHLKKTATGGGYSENCTACHNTGKWKGAAFDHLTEKARLCAECHSPPKDALHSAAKEGCGACHGTRVWKPSTYDHEKYFSLDKNHLTPCATCHDKGTYQKYTCLNCHQHSGRGIEREHRGERIGDYGDCLRCHRMEVNGKVYGHGRGHEGMGGKREHGREREED